MQLACFYCRSKRIRCSGTKPICTVSFFYRSIRYMTDVCRHARKPQFHANGHPDDAKNVPEKKWKKPND